MQSVENLKGSAVALSHLERQGFRIWDTSDPANINDLIELPNNAYITTRVDTQSNDFTSNNCVWLVLYDQNDTVCALAGIKVDKIPQGDWVAFWGNHYQRTAPDGAGIIDESHASPIVRRMSGRCAYFGDLWLRSSASVDIASFAILVQSIAITQFMADWVYTSIPDAQARNGLIYDLRLANSVPMVHRWLGEPAPNRSDSDWLLCSSKEDAEYAIHSYRQSKQSGIVAARTTKVPATANTKAGSTVVPFLDPTRKPRT